MRGKGLLSPVPTTRSRIFPTGSLETSRTGRFRNSDTKYPGAGGAAAAGFGRAIGA